MKTRLFSLLMALCAINNLFAYDFKYGNLYYNILNNSEVAVCKVQSNDGSNAYKGLSSIEIPGNVVYNGITYSVTIIGYSAFHGCSGITSVTIPNSVTSIGNRAFYCCSGLTSVTIGNSVTDIGFNITNNGTSVFDGCTGLTSIILESGNPKYDSRNNCNAIIETSTNTLIQGCKATIIPNSVKRIGNCAFEGCIGLTSVTIPNSVKRIGSRAFLGCIGLTSVTIPNSVTSIAVEAFFECTGLTSVTIPNSVTSIESSAFTRCRGLTSVTIPNSVTSIGERAFLDCTGLTSVTIGNSVANIGENVFEYNTKLRKIIVLPAECPSYDKSSFSSDIDSIAVPKCYLEKYKSAQWGGFSEDKFYTHKLRVHAESIDNILGSIVFPTKDTLVDCGEMVTAIAEPSFGHIFDQWSDGNTENPRTIEVDNADISLTALFAKAYSGACGEEAQWQYANGTLSITGTGTMYDYAWDNVPWWLFRDSIQQVNIVEGITSIGAYCFTGLSCVTNITLPNSVTHIGDKALSDNVNLETVSMGENIDTMGDSVFSNDLRLYQIVCKTQRVPTISEETFSGVSGRVPIYVPAACVNKYRIHAYWGRQNIRSLGDLTTYSVTAGCDPRFGITTGSGTYFEGESVTLAAIPNEGYMFVRWSNGVADNPYSFAASENLTLTAQFVSVTGVENVQDEGTCTAKKIIRNGQVLIVRNGKIYTMTGQETE